LTLLEIRSPSVSICLCPLEIFVDPANTFVEVLRFRENNKLRMREANSGAVIFRRGGNSLHPKLTRHLHSLFLVGNNNNSLLSPSSWLLMSFPDCHLSHLSLPSPEQTTQREEISWLCAFVPLVASLA